jgi:two-component system, sensor histidine kinase and response regulator
MPPEWVAQLYEAASLCSDDIILDLLDQIPEDKFSLARTLTDLANDFQFDKIKNLTQ